MRQIKAKFISTCAETGAKIKKGESIIYDPSAKKAYSMNSKKAKDWQNNSESRNMAAWENDVLEANYYRSYH